MQSLEVSDAVRPVYGSLGVKRLKEAHFQQDMLTHYRQHATTHPDVPGGGTVVIPGK